MYNMITINNARIVDIGKNDAFYQNRDVYVGMTGTFKVHKIGEYFDSGTFLCDGTDFPLTFKEVKVAHEENPVTEKTSCLTTAVNFETGRKEDSGKLRMDLIAPEALEELARVLGHGAKKYADWNWSKGIKYSRVIAAVLRHINSWRKLEDNDPETGLNHLSHAFCGLMFLITYTARNMTYFDDRIEGNKKTAKPYCYDCGTDLETTEYNIECGTGVSPCKSCIKVSYNAGYDKCVEDCI